MADDTAPADDILSVIEGAPNPDAGDTGDEGEEYVEGSPPSQSDTPADDAETTDANVEEDNEEPKKKKVETVPLSRLNEVTKARREAERRAIAAEAKAAAHEELLQRFPNLAQPGVNAPEAAAAPADPEPTEENFRTLEEYEEARLSWRVRQEVAKVEATRQAQTQQQRQQARAAEAEKRVADFMQNGEKSFPGFKQSVAHLADTLDRSPSISSTVLELPEGPDVLLYMARKPEEAERIAALSPVRQAVEIGALAERIRVARAAKKNTNASPPINPLGGSSAPAPKDPEKMTMAEYKAWRAGKEK